MKFVKTHFGSYENQKVIKYTLENDHGTRISVLNYAGIWQEFSVLEHGQRRQLLLQSDSIQNYTNNDLYMNRVIARTAGRIRNGRFSLNDQNIQTSQNENKHSLHGGENGFAKQFFDVITHPDQRQIVLKKTLTESDDTFPGSLDLTVIYTLTESDKVTISFIGKQTVADGVFNPTMHAYFNLAEETVHDIQGHDLWLNSQQHLEMDAQKIPTGQLISNQAAFDLKNNPNLGQALTSLQKAVPEAGFDDVFVIDGHAKGPIAHLTDRQSNYEIAIYSKRNALVVYTANGLHDDLSLNHGGGQPWIGVALEAQTLPNSENIPSFGDVTLAQDSQRKESISYQFLAN